MSQCGHQLRRKLPAFEQNCRVYIQSVGNLFYYINGHRKPFVLDLANVGTAHARAGRQGFLAQADALATIDDVLRHARSKVHIAVLSRGQSSAPRDIFRIRCNLRSGASHHRNCLRLVGRYGCLMLRPREGVCAQCSKTDTQLLLAERQKRYDPSLARSSAPGCSPAREQLLSQPRQFALGATERALVPAVSAPPHTFWRYRRSRRAKPSIRIHGLLSRSCP